MRMVMNKGDVCFDSTLCSQIKRDRMNAVGIGWFAVIGEKVVLILNIVWLSIFFYLFLTASVVSIRVMKMTMFQ